MWLLCIFQTRPRCPQWQHLSRSETSKTLWVVESSKPEWLYLIYHTLMQIVRPGQWTQHSWLFWSRCLFPSQRDPEERSWGAGCCFKTRAVVENRRLWVALLIACLRLRMFLIDTRVIWLMSECLLRKCACENNCRLTNCGESIGFLIEGEGLYFSVSK